MIPSGSDFIHSCLGRKQSLSNTGIGDQYIAFDSTCFSVSLTHETGSMQIFDVHIRMRPIRIAFIVPENNAESVQRAININSFLWGGHLNPILPLISTVDDRWKILGQPELISSQILNGCLEAFDPDFVCYVNCDAPPSVSNTSRIVVGVDDILSQLKSSGSPYYGVGYYELARYFGYEEMRFERKKPLHLVTPSIDSHCGLFLSSVVGQLPNEISEDVRTQLKDAYDAPHFTASISEYYQCLKRSYITLLRLIQTGLESPEFGDIVNCCGRGF